MFARKVSMQLRQGSSAEFTKRIAEDVLPLLRRQRGLRDEITCVTTGHKGSIRNQFVGKQRERGGVRPRIVWRSNEVSGGID